MADRRSERGRKGIAALASVLCAAAGVAVAWTLPTTASISCRIGTCLVEANRHVPWRIGVVLAGLAVAFVVGRLALRTDVPSSTAGIASALALATFALAVHYAARVTGGYIPVDDASTSTDTWMAFRVAVSVAGFTIAVATALALRLAQDARTRARAMAIGVFVSCILGGIVMPSHLVCPIERFWVANESTGRCVDISRGGGGLSSTQPPEPTRDLQLPERLMIVATGLAAGGMVLAAGSPWSDVVEPSHTPERSLEG
jgi:hypothetical protein